MTRIETSNALGLSSSTKLNSNQNLQEASHDIVAASSIPVGIMRPNHELLPAVAAKLGFAA